MEVRKGARALPEGGEAMRRQKVLLMSVLVLTIANVVAMPHTLVALAELGGGGGQRASYLVKAAVALVEASQ
jgi:hypothetical protein